MQRSYLLSIDFKINSITDWVAAMKTNPLYAILSGFEFGNTPGIGTFYDFLAYFGIQIMTIFYHMNILLKQKKSKNLKQKGPKPISLKKLLLQNLFLN